MRKFFAKVHLWLSMPPGIIIVTVYLTGMILVLETEILELGYPSRYSVKEVKGEPLSPAALMESVRQQLPDSVRINGTRISSDPRRTYQLVLPGKKAAGFIDPHTGEVIGMDDGQGFFLKMVRLHRWLFDEYERDGSFSWRKLIAGHATLILAIIIVSGVVIWHPRNKKVLRNRSEVKTKAGWFRLFYDLYTSEGFYAALPLLILVLTGLAWSFNWYRNVFYSIFGINANPPQAHRTPVSSGVKKPVKKKIDYTQWAEVLSALKSHYPDFNSTAIQDGPTTAPTICYESARGSDRYSFDPAMGEITEVQLYKDLPKSGKIGE